MINKKDRFAGKFL